MEMALTVRLEYVTWTKNIFLEIVVMLLYCDESLKIIRRSTFSELYKYEEII